MEAACRLGAADAGQGNRIKDYYRGILGRKIRPLALALIKNSKNQILVSNGRDSVKDETFYRPIGGGIEFSESGRSALAREVMEETGLEVSVSPVFAVLENIFEYEGRKERPRARHAISSYLQR